MFFVVEPLLAVTLLSSLLPSHGRCYHRRDDVSWTLYRGAATANPDTVTAKIHKKKFCML